MYDFEEIATEGIFHQEDNVNGMSFAKLYKREDYEPNKYFFRGNPINQMLVVAFPKTHKEEFITVELVPEETNNIDAYAPRQKALGCFAKEGSLHHGKGFEKAKHLLSWETSLRNKEKPIHTFKITPGKEKAVIYFYATTGWEENNIAASIPSFGSMRIEELNSQVFKIYASGNNLFPNYNDLVFKLTSVITPIKDLVSFI